MAPPLLGTGTADEWPHVFRGVSFVTGIESKSVPGSAEGSDQWSFIEKGVPGVQLFTGTHEDYHRPGDTPDEVDAAGLVKVATFVKEAVSYLAAEREEPRWRRWLICHSGCSWSAPASRPPGRCNLAPYAVMQRGPPSTVISCISTIF